MIHCYTSDVCLQEAPKVLMLSCSELFILNANSLQPLYTIGLADIVKLTTSPFNDGIVVFHTKEVSNLFFLLPLYYRTYT